LIADTGATAGPYAGDGIVDTNAGETAAGEASASSSGQPQNPRRVLIIVGDPGLGEHNSGRNLDRVAATKKEELEAQGDTAIVQRASGFQDFANALTNNGVLDGVEYVGHASNIALYVGEQPGPATNVDHSNIPQLSNANLSKNAYVKLNGCNSSAGGQSQSPSGLRIDSAERSLLSLVLHIFPGVPRVLNRSEEVIFLQREAHFIWWAILALKSYILALVSFLD